MVIVDVIENPIFLIKKQFNERKIRKVINWRYNRFWDSFFRIIPDRR